MLMAAGVTAAVVVGAFVFWGPSGMICQKFFDFLCEYRVLSIFQSNYFAGSSRLRQRRGQIAGLHNFGRTCFLNTLLQALAACPQFIAWLQLHGASDKKSLIGSLLNTLEGEMQLSNSTVFPILIDFILLSSDKWYASYAKSRSLFTWSRSSSTECIGLGDSTG